LVIISFNSKTLKNVKQQMPELKTLLLLSLKTFNSIKLSSLSAHKLLKKQDDIDADGISTSVSQFLNKNYIYQFIARGYEYHLWTVDNKKISEKFIKIGINSITTNNLNTIRQIQYSSSRN